MNIIDWFHTLTTQNYLVLRIFRFMYVTTPSHNITMCNICASVLIKRIFCTVVQDNRSSILLFGRNPVKYVWKIKYILFCDEKIVHEYYRSIRWLDRYVFIVCEFIIVNIWKLSNTSSIISTIHYEWNWYRILNKVYETLENFSNTFITFLFLGKSI